MIPIAVICLHNLVTAVFALRALGNRQSFPLTDEASVTTESDVGTGFVRRVSQRLYAALVVCGAFTLSVCLGYLHVADPQIYVIRCLFSIALVLTGLVVFGMFCLFLDDVRNVILPNKCRSGKRLSEVEAPLSFQNTLYPEDAKESDDQLLDTVETPDNSDTKN